MTESINNIQSLEEVTKAIENLKNIEFPKYCQDSYSKKEDYIEEIYSILKKEFSTAPPNLLMPIECKNFKLNLFRVRDLSTFTDLDVFSEYSYPPISLTKMGRCNFPEKPVFYCSENPITALFETVRNHDYKDKKYVISKWNVNKTDEILFFENFLRSNLPEENFFFNFQKKSRR